MQTAC